MCVSLTFTRTLVPLPVKNVCNIHEMVHLGSNSSTVLQDKNKQTNKNHNFSFVFK